MIEVRVEQPIERIIDHSIYPRQALADARQAYKEYCIFKVSPMSHGRAAIQIQVKPAQVADTRQIVLEFFNYALDRAVQIQLSKS
mgnify:CR=1 FL=1